MKCSQKLGKKQFGSNSQLANLSPFLRRSEPKTSSMFWSRLQTLLAASERRATAGPSLTRSPAPVGALHVCSSRQEPQEHQRGIREDRRHVYVILRLLLFSLK